MGYREDYLARINASGSTYHDVYKNSTNSLVSDTFTNSPTYRIVDINGVNTGVRLLSTKISTEKRILLRPTVQIVKGSIITIDSNKWIAITVNYNSFDNYSADLKLCNESIKWRDQSVTFEYPCVATNKSIIFSQFGINNGEFISLPSGVIDTYVQCNTETSGVKVGTRFILSNKVYQAKGVDDVSDVISGVGILRISLEITTKRDSDDFVNKLADNKPNNSGGANRWST